MLRPLSPSRLSSPHPPPALPQTASVGRGGLSACREPRLKPSPRFTAWLSIKPHSNYPNLVEIGWFLNISDTSFLSFRGQREHNAIISQLGSGVCLPIPLCYLRALTLGGAGGPLSLQILMYEAGTVGSPVRELAGKQAVPLRAVKRAGPRPSRRSQEMPVE